MFKEYVRQDEYIITAIIFVRKLLDTNAADSHQFGKEDSEVSSYQ